MPTSTSGSSHSKPRVPLRTSSIANWLDGGTHPSGVGLVDALPYLARQQRLTFARIGLTDPLS
ncbi:hypothetical protein SB751_35435, partial [Cupriavidus sp. SIMBA_020]|uniref:hypothetical protein n=1 Tax=Cupriavidus sp. SIMBA_020 TaxID=3085766 RepID=UPI0039783D62